MGISSQEFVRLAFLSAKKEAEEEMVTHEIWQFHYLRSRATKGQWEAILELLENNQEPIHFSILMNNPIEEIHS